MMNLLYEPFPDTVTADGREYGILTDFREWLRFADMLADKEITAEERAYLCTEWFDPEPLQMTEGMVDALLGFYRADALMPDKLNDSDEQDEEAGAPKPPLFDWKFDAKCLLGDFRYFYGIDLLHMDYLHWWEFLSLFLSLPDESHCSKRISIRAKNLGEVKDPNERKRIAKMKRQVALPFEYTDEMIGAALWNMQ